MRVRHGMYRILPPIFFFQAEDGIRDYKVTGVQTCALPIWSAASESLTSAGQRPAPGPIDLRDIRSEEHTSELQSPCNLVCRLLLEKKKKKTHPQTFLHHFATHPWSPCLSLASLAALNPLSP